MRGWILVFLITAAIVLVVAYSVIVARQCRQARRRRREARLWVDLVSRHQELDHELEKVWQCW